MNSFPDLFDWDSFDLFDVPNIFFKNLSEKDEWPVLREHRYSLTNTVLTNVVSNNMVFTKMVFTTEISTKTIFTNAFST